MRCYPEKIKEASTSFYDQVIIIIRVATIVLAAIILNSCKNAERKSPPVAKDGVIDLSGWNFSQDGIVELRGEWRFTWRDFPALKNNILLRQDHSQRMHVPGRWDAAVAKDELTDKISGIGFASYMLEIKFSEESRGLIRDLAFNYMAGSASKLFILDNKATKILTSYNQGVVSSEPTKEIPILLSRIKNMPDTNARSVIMVVQISNFHLARGGFWKAPKLGLDKNLKFERIKDLISSLLLIGALLVISFYHLMLYMQRREDITSFSFFLFCLVMAIREMTYAKLFETLSLQSSVANFNLSLTIGYLTIPFMMITGGYFIMNLVPGKTFSKFYKFLVMVAIFLIGFTSYNSPITFTQYLLYYNICILIGAITTFIHLLVVSFRKSPNKSIAQLICVSLGLVVLGAVNDILHQHNIISSGYYAAYTFIGFILIQSGIISGKFRDAYRKAHYLSENLKTEVKHQTIELRKTTEIAVKAKEESEEAHLEANVLRAKAEEQAEKLEEMDKIKTSFFQNMSHELRTPLTLILNPLESLLSRLPKDSDVEVAHKNANRLLRLVNQLLDIQKLEAGKKELNLAPVNLSQIVGICGDYFTAACKNKNIKFLVKYNNQILTSSSTPCWIMGEIDALEKIAFNYLSNALKYTAQEGQIEMGIRSEGDCIRFYVSDNGNGISEEDEKKLFQLFSQAEQPINRNHEGTGLGLALVKSLTEQMNGTFGVDSKLGEGSCFWVDFHMIEKFKDVKEILIVESDDEMRQNLKVYLTSEIGVANDLVYIASESKEALDALDEFSFRCVLVDYQIDGIMTGLELLNEITEEYPQTKRVLITGETDLEQMQKAINRGIIDQFFYKSFDLENLGELVQDLIRKSTIRENCILAEDFEIKSWILAEEPTKGEVSTDKSLNIPEKNNGDLIIFADDIEDMRRMISGMLQKHGYCVAVAEDGQQALEIAQKKLPDLIITDWMMPNLSGPELIEELSQDDHLSSVPTILLTAKNDEESKIAGTEIGATAFLGKPFSEIELMSNVSNLLNLSRQNRMLVRKEESDLKIELVGNLAHRINNPMHHILSMQGVMSQNIKKIHYKLSELLSEGEEARMVMASFEDDLQSLEQSIDWVKDSIGRTQESLEEIFNLSGIEGVNVNIIDMKDLFAKLEQRITAVFGEDFCASILFELDEGENLDVLCNYHVLGVVIEKIIRIISKSGSGKDKLTLSANVINDIGGREISIESVNKISSFFKNTDINMIKMILRPYEISFEIVEIDAGTKVMLGIPHDLRKAA